MTDTLTPDAAPIDLLKLVAFDGEDLEIVSAHLQDAVVVVSDIIWLPLEKRLVIALNRFDWIGALAAKPACRRRRAALRLEVECIEAELADLGPAWAAVRCPGHPEAATTSPV